MSHIPDALRLQVVARAANCCEYCHLPSRGQVATFPVDHVIPRSKGGATQLENLALSCPVCNGHKWSASDGEDPVSGVSSPLFNPRTDLWTEHFQWSREVIGLLEGKTARGRATISRMQMNHPDLIAIRQILASLGLFPEVRI
jgi:hypothetical protein